MPQAFVSRTARRFGYLLRMVNVEESDISSIRRSHPRNHLDLVFNLESSGDT